MILFDDIRTNQKLLTRLSRRVKLNDVRSYTYVAHAHTYTHSKRTSERMQTFALLTTLLSFLFWHFPTGNVAAQKDANVGKGNLN